MVYFIAAENDAVKIGYVGWDVWGRLRSLGNSHYRELRLLGVMEGGRELERSLHARFADERIRHEWFRPSPRLLEFIERSADQPEPRTPRRPKLTRQEEKLERERLAHAQAVERAVEERRELEERLKQPVTRYDLMID